MLSVLIYGKDESEHNRLSDPLKDVWITHSVADAKRHILMEDIMMIIIDLCGSEKKAMELADFIRQVPRQCMTPILFLSDSRKREWWAFHKIHCYDYMLKPIEPMQVLQVFFLCLKRMSDNERNQPIVFPVGSRRFPVYPREIVYLDTSERTVVVHTTTVDLKVPSLHLNEFVKLFGEQFLRIHRTTVVNREQIRCIDFRKSVVEMKNGRAVLDIGRTYIAMVRKEFDER